MKLSDEDRDNLFKYTRYFALKASQIIVSSRSGQKDCTPCRKKSDWFNLNVSDISGLLATAKKNISNKINSGSPVCVEIFLQTPEGDKMVLETWCVFLSPEHSATSPKVTHTVYNQMGILLKSLVSVTRVIPAYKLSQKQGFDTYTIYFRMYEKEPETYALGEGCKQVIIGQICTPVGTVLLSVAYRVKMTITPTHSSSQESSMLLKSDHFNTNICPRTNTHQQREDKSRRKGHQIKAAFAEPRVVRDKEGVVSFKPGGVLWNPKLYCAIIEGQEPKSVPWQKSSTKSVILHPQPEFGEIGVSDSVIYKEKLGRLIVPNSDDPSSSKKSSSCENMNLILKFSKQTCRRIGKPVHYPFATPTPKSELVNFYRECAHAPPLVSLAGTTSSFKNITEQLMAFELKAKEFDEMVKTLSESPDSDY